MDVFNWRNINWRWKIVDYGIKKRLNIFVFEGWFINYRNKVEIDCFFVDVSFKLFVVYFFVFKIGFYCCFILFYGGFNYFFLKFFCVCLKVIGNINIFEFSFKGFVFLDYCFYFDKIDKIGKFIFSVDWNLEV